MKRCLFLIMLLVCPAVMTLADEDAPKLPRVPRGFDEGRVDLMAEAAENPIGADALVSRVFDHADLTELAEFIFVHFQPDEKDQLTRRLKLGRKLGEQADAGGVGAALQAEELTAKTVASEIGEMLVARALGLQEVIAWLYARDVNFRTLQRAMNGERMDAYKLRTELRVLESNGATAAEVFVPGLWEFNLDDAREEKGGYYDGVQLVDILLQLGWKVSDFEAAVGKPLTDTQRELVTWADPELLWQTLNPRIPESDLMRAGRKHYADKRAPEVLELAMRRAETTTRWFRTGGAGVTGVYVGPWPNAKGEPKPPTSQLADLGAEPNELVEALSDEVRGHFGDVKDSLLIVMYEDGSARAVIDKSSREPVNYGPASPLGNTQTTAQLYDGRLSLRGRNGLFYMIYGNGTDPAPAEFEFANVRLTSGGAFLIADLDDGLIFTPVLLRRTSRLVEIE